MTKTLYHGGMSGGKDSTAAALFLIHESGIPHDQIQLTFCDTGNEVEETYGFIEKFSREVFPVKTIRGPKGFYQLAKDKGRFPSPRARFCTEELKIKPTMAHLESLQNEGCDLVLVSGVRAAESFERSALPEREYDERYDCEHWRPLLRWSLDDVWAIHRKYGVEPNPLYAKGSNRVGCFPCIMSQKREIALIARNFPHRIDLIREAERVAREETERGGATFFASDKIPLRFRLTVWQRPGTENISDSREMPETVEVDSPDRLLDITPLKRKSKRNAGVNRHAVAAIDDVVRWAEMELTAEEAQLVADFEREIERTPSCSNRWGLCE